MTCVKERTHGIDARTKREEGHTTQPAPSVSLGAAYSYQAYTSVSLGAVFTFQGPAPRLFSPLWGDEAGIHPHAG